MLFPDLSAPEAKPKQHPKSAGYPIAFVADRSLALLLDFLIFSPIVSFILAGFVRQTRTFFLLDMQSHEGVLAGALVFLVGAIIVIFLQALSLFYWQATPGQIFAQMRVVNFPDFKKPLTFSQSLLRSTGWALQFLFAALPFTEVLSHPLRRCLHERASDTMVVTLKTIPDEGPMPLEAKFVSSWLRMSFLFLLLFGFVSVLKTYSELVAGQGKSSSYGLVGVCKELKDLDLYGSKRIDAALSLFLIDEITPDCLNKEAEASLWGDSINSQDLAYLARYLVSSGAEQDLYQEKICSAAGSTSCLLVQYLKAGNSAKTLELADKKLWVTQTLLAEERFEKKDYAASLDAIARIQKDTYLSRAFEKRFVRSVWALAGSKKDNSLRGRKPASTQESWIEEFKERYDLQ